MARPEICVIVSPTQQEIYFTVTQSYTISRKATVTDFKIDDGRKITDHHTPDNKRFVFSGIVTVQAALGESDNLDPSTILSKLDALIDTGEKFKYISDSELGFAETEDCVLLSYDISRDEEMEEAVEIDVEITQVQFTESVERTQSVAQPDQTDISAGQTNTGNQPVITVPIPTLYEQRALINTALGRTL